MRLYAIEVKNYLSEPARSTKFNLPNLKCFIESFSQQLSMLHVKTLWDRLLSAFIWVAAIFLFAAPCGRKDHQNNFLMWKVLRDEGSVLSFTCNKILRMSSTELTLTSVRFSTYTPFFKSSLSYHISAYVVTDSIWMCNTSAIVIKQNWTYQQISRWRLKEVRYLLIIYL